LWLERVSVQAQVVGEVRIAVRGRGRKRGPEAVHIISHIEDRQRLMIERGNTAHEEGE
jgi:hypothetical protein